MKSLVQIVQETRFTELEVIELWNIFVRDFPHGKINRNEYIASTAVRDIIIFPYFRVSF